MTKQFILALILLVSLQSHAQLYEVGVIGGGANYVGDVGREYYIYPNNYHIGGVFKYNVNQRFALRIAYTFAKITASDADAVNKVRQQRNYNFSNTIQELSAGIEFNFWKFNINDREKFYTPYILFEAAAFRYDIVDGYKDVGGIRSYDYVPKTSLALPFGVGYKFRLTRSLVMALEARGRYTFTDQIDFNSKEIRELDFGNDSNDWYFFTGAQLTYTFGRPSCYSKAF